MQTMKYEVFPGISLIYRNTVPGEDMPEELSEEKRDTVFEISHCKEGRIECRMRGAYVSLAPGDLAIIRGRDRERGVFFPQGEYLGITIVIDTALTPACLSCFLADVNVSPAHLMKRFCDGGKFYISRSDQRIEHIFSELYSVPQSVRDGYHKIKVMELMLFLSTLDAEGNENEAHTVSESQLTLARSVSGYLCRHAEERVTLEQLSSVFHVSGTGIKNCFRSVYGTSPHAYIRTYKMKLAAGMLLQTDRSVLEIAGSVGFDNGSKFAKAFRDVMGLSPLAYRRCHTDRIAASADCGRY